jgi:hypothetical protein
MPGHDPARNLPFAHRSKEPVMGIVAWIILLLGAGLLAVVLLLAYFLATSRTTRTGRRHSHPSYDSGTPALVRAEKRLYQDCQPRPASRLPGQPPL